MMLTSTKYNAMHTYATHQIEISLKGTKLRSFEIGREDLFGEGSHIDNMECSATTRP
jgi:hypothetical protein